MKKLLLITFGISLMTIILNSCYTLPTREAVNQTSSHEDYTTTVLADIFVNEIETNTEESGFILLRDGRQALIERLYLAVIAEKRIDAQYYIWNSDKTGKLLMQKLLQAAERGVTVRLLLDDFSVGDRNDQLLTINSHPNIQVRIYNPFLVRTGLGKWLDFAFDFDRLNRRSHNKTYTVDRMVAVTGGRNIGDEYFDANEHLNFNDADLLSTGPVVRQVVDSFEEYWQSPWAVPIDQLLDHSDATTHEDTIQAFIAEDMQTVLGLTLQENHGSLKQHFTKIRHDMIRAPATFLADKPGGTTNKAYSDDPKRVALKLMDLATESRDEILIESAYFVLNEEALELASQLRDKSVKVRALTNSMSSNDVLPNHASYAMVREDMLDHGIELHELRPDAASCPDLLGREDYCDENSHLGLHAKTAVFDRKTVYVGSMNLNLRSAYLNTEAAMIVDSPQLAEQLAEQIELNMKMINCWKVTKSNGSVIWTTERNGIQEISNHEPLTGWLDRVEAGMLKLVPGALYY